MTAPEHDRIEGFPEEEQPKTYSEWLDQLACTCPAGVQIRPSSLPSATIDLGDVIADHTRILSTFTSAYSAITVVLKMIACIIDVLCCIANPFCLIYAMIRLFGTCIPDFILIFPQFALPAIIICVIKIILAIIEYILTVILPIIEDIVQNIQDLIDAFEDNNEDAQAAVAFKLAALMKEIFNIIGIISVLGALWIMIKALLSAGIGIPCGGSGGSCSECGDDEDICPTILQETTFSGTDGRFTILYGSDEYDFNILFYSPLKKNDFIEIRKFFPKGLNYSEIDEDDVPYKLNVSGSTYIISSVDSGGYCSLQQLPPEYFVDGYLSNTDINELPLSTLRARFNTKTETFTSSYINKYITLQDLRGVSYSSINSGTWRIQSVYDGYNVLLERSADTWSYGSPSEHLRWKIEPFIPSLTTNLDFEVEINHEELIRHGLIGVGCHPAIGATKTALNNRFPDINATLPDLPDLDALINNLGSCMVNIAPTNVDSQYILDNYETIANEIGGLESCIRGYLETFQGEAEDYAKNIYPTLFNPENAIFTVNPAVQIVGRTSEVRLTPYDRNGGLLGLTVPSDIVEAEINSNFGTLSSVETELVDDELTGRYISTIISHTPGIATITAKIGNRDVAYFDGYNLIPQEIQVEFVSAEKARSLGIYGETSSEPVGRSS